MSVDTRSLFRAAYPGGRRTLYVSGAGDDRSSGQSRATAKRTIQAIVPQLQPGDRVVVGTGTYGYTQFYGVNGRADAWITIEADTGAKPVVDVSASVASWDPSLSTNGIDIQLSSYLGVHGLEVRGNQRSRDTNPSGIAVFRRSSHIALWANDVHDFPGGGVNCFWVDPTPWGSQTLPGGGWDGVDVFFNRIHGTSRYSPSNTSGISFYGGQDITGGTIDGRYGYRAVGNYVYDVMCLVPYSVGGLDMVTDGNGISVDSLAVPNGMVRGAAVYAKRGLVEGNVIVACGGRAVHVYNSRNVDVVNNTLVGNLRSTSSAIRGSTEVDVQFDGASAGNGVVIANNMIAPTNTPRAFDRVAQTVVGNTAVGGTDAVPAGNQSVRAAGLRVFTAVPTAAALVAGMPIASFVPRSVTTVPRRTGSVGQQPLGVGTRTGQRFAVGALER